MFRKIIILSTLFSTLSLPAMATDNVQQSVTQKPKGEVSVSGASTLDTLTKMLARKSADSGSSNYRITSAGGKNKFYGTAVIY
ncbi:YdgH/BhsA/McbA-like domain containing protein [Tatumella sp. UBA2305]|uniref:YdgH/BhsA/McbA-like domain containing protein n=1 Tax=Tatumella sp. UBA2305 TaxID=1947647 RepID=UPI0039C928D0